MESIAPDLEERHVYTCGPPGFMDAARAILGQMGFALDRLHAESFGGLRVSAEHQGVAAAGSEDGPYTVDFARAGKQIRTDGTRTLLELAEHHDVELDYGCRSGSCGDCKVKVLSGEATMRCDDGISDEERAEGYVLSCVAVPRGSCTIDV